jgi:signal transduction histidine kinase
LLVAVALLVYLPVAVAISRLPAQPRALSTSWWAGVLADCLALGLLLGYVEQAEPVAFAGFLLVMIVQGTVFGLRAGIVAALVASAAATVGHVVQSHGHLQADHVVDLVAFVVVAGIVTHVVGRQAEELRVHRARLEEALADLRRVDELRAALVSTLAHDIRGPLGGIRGSIQTALRPELDADVRTELLEGAERQSARLVRLAMGLLDLARLEEGRLELDLEALSLREAVERALPAADLERRVEVRIDPDICVEADAERLDQIIVNLVTNTLRHGAPPFVVDASRSNGWVDIAVRDGGTGVQDDEVGSLFQPFRRGDSAGSVGFGLWIVKMLTEAQGGRVSYEPNRPTGACFRVTLPAAEGCR